MRHHLHFSLDAADLDRLDAWARQHGVTRSQAIRLAIRAVTAARVEDPLLQLSGDIPDLPADLSERFSEYFAATFVAGSRTHGIRRRAARKRGRR